MTAAEIIGVLTALTSLVATFGALWRVGAVKEKVDDVHALVNSRLTEFVERYDRMEVALKEVREELLQERADRVAERVAARKASEGPQL